MELIVSVQGKNSELNTAVIQDCINAGASMVRTDKPVQCRVPIIGLQKIKVSNRARVPYITPMLENVKYVSKWAMYVAVDCRIENRENLVEIFSYATHNNIKIVADLQKIEDYENIVDQGYVPAFVTTALGIFGSAGMPPYDLMDELIVAGCENIIAEGNISSANRIAIIKKKGIDYICIGAAISDPYKLTKQFVRDMLK